jgi:hypothetical protein
MIHLKVRSEATDRAECVFRLKHSRTVSSAPFRNALFVPLGQLKMAVESIQQLFAKRLGLKVHYPLNAS